MRSHCLAHAALFLALSTIAVAGQPPPSAPLDGLTLEAALELAEQRSPLLTAATHAVKAAEGRLRQARLPPNPALAITQSNLFNGDLSGFDGETATYELEQPIEIGGRRSARVEAATAATERATLDAAVSHLEVRAAATQAFERLLLSAERARIAAEALQLAESVEEVARARVEAGRIAPLEQSRAAIATSSARIELQNADGELGVDKARLAAHWGGSPPVSSVEGRIEPPGELPALATLAPLLEVGADAARWTAILREHDGLVRMARAEGRPTIALTGGWTNYRDADESAWLLGVRVGLPLANRNQGGVAEALALRDKADAERVAAATELSLRLVEAHQAATSASAAARALATDVVPAARLAFATATEGFEAGKFSYLDVLDARRTLLEARRQEISALSTYSTARAEISRLVGGRDNAPVTDDSNQTETQR